MEVVEAASELAPSVAVAVKVTVMSASLCSAGVTVQEAPAPVTVQSASQEAEIESVSEPSVSTSAGERRSTGVSMECRRHFWLGRTELSVTRKSVRSPNRF